MTTEATQTEIISYYDLIDGTATKQDWTGERTAAVAAAVAHLGAVSVRDGYVYRAEESGSWWLVDEADMAEAGAAILGGAGDWYSLWCASSTAEEVSGLDHDTLDAICDAGGDAERDYSCQCGSATGTRCSWSGHREQLVTVRWVPESDRGSAKASGTYTHGGYALKLYVSPECADMLAHIYDEEGEQTEEEDPFVRIVGATYA